MEFRIPYIAHGDGQQDSLEYVTNKATILDVSGPRDPEPGDLAPRYFDIKVDSTHWQMMAKENIPEEIEPAEHSKIMVTIESMWGVVLPAFGVKEPEQLRGLECHVLYSAHNGNYRLKGLLNPNLPVFLQKD